MAACKRKRTKVGCREFGETPIPRLCNEVRKLEDEKKTAEMATHSVHARAHAHTHRKILCTLAFQKITICFQGQ